MNSKSFTYVLVCIIVSIIAAGCEDTPPPAPKINIKVPSLPAPPPPAIGDLQWSSRDNCLYIFNGSVWTPHGYCRRWVNSSTFDIIPTAAPSSPYSRVDGSDPTFVKVYYYQTNLQTAVRRDTGEVFVQVGNEWLTQDEYNRRLLAKAQQERDRQKQEEIERTRMQVQTMTQEMNNTAVRIFTRPNCASSYNGCP